MASLAASTCRLSARAISRRISSPATARAFSNGPVSLAAQNFSMPALSPTMTEGNIATWKVKEGDSYVAGDVLLEIETDKATMDVEAQDDGIMAKILEKDGAKAVKVGTRIAVTAEPGDDLSSLELPADDSAPAKPSAPKKEQPAPQAETKKPTPTKASPSASQSPPSQRPASSSPDRAQSQTTSSGKPMSTKYPLYPSVEHLLHTHSIPESVFSQIPATGPAGRLLKGDVLAHLGKVAASYPSDQAARLDKLGHLDLSNIKKAAPPAKKPAAAAAAAKPAATPEVPTQVAVHVSLAAVLATQQRLRDALGLDLPLATFIARASALANEDLPLAGPPSADALFDALVGRPGAAARSSHGSYTPQITALPPAVAVPRAAAPPPPRRRVDIIDVLTGKTAPKRALGPAAPAGRGVAGVGAAGSNVFSVEARRGEERRVRTYLERVKTVLEKEPARLVL